MACQPHMVSKEHATQSAELVLNDHVLVNRIWDVQNRRFIDKIQLLSKISTTDYLLLGEIHDNILHHQNQAWIIDNLDTRDRVTGVAFEMIDERQGKLIKNIQFSTSEELIDILNKIEAGWDYTRNYKIVFDSIIKRDFTIYPANLDRETLMSIVMRGNEQLPPKIKSVMEMTPLTDEQVSSVQQEIIKSHCDLLDNTMAAAMVEGQRIRDTAMSVNLFEINADLKLLITGSGHARKDRGIPIYLHSQDSDANVISIAMLEVEKGANVVAQYTERWDSNSLPFDYVWFTARTEREDPCIELKKHFSHKRESK